MNRVVLRSLRTIYENGRVKINKTLQEDPDIRFLVEQTEELHLYAGYLIKGAHFDEWYEKNHKT